jgi:hypothetical protein
MTTRCARCARCGTSRGLHHNGFTYVCSDARACRRNQAAAGDPALALMADDWDAAAPAVLAPAGTACTACRAPAPAAELYDRGGGRGEWFHRDRAACERAMAGDLEPQIPDNWDPSLAFNSADMRAAVSAGGPDPVVGGRPLDPETAALIAFHGAAQRAASGR